VIDAVGKLHDNGNESGREALNVPILSGWRNPGTIVGQVSDTPTDPPAELDRE
jgi:hypothetical protein